MTTPSNPTIDSITGKPYRLRLIAQAEDLRHYRLDLPDEGRIQSTNIVFAGGCTVIFGDLCPGRNGVVSTFGYGLAFLAKPRSPHYLAEKFLSTGWHAALAHAGVDHLAAEEPERISADNVRELHGMIDDYDVRGFSDWFTDHGFDSESIPGHGYDPAEVDLLSLINRRFAALIATLEVSNG